MDQRIAHDEHPPDQPNAMTNASVDETATPAEETGVSVTAPTQSDSVIAESSELIGGPMGRHAYSSWRFWGPLPILVLFTLGAWALNLISKLPCSLTDWADPGRYTHACYTDIAPLFTLRGFADNAFPYVSNPLPGTEQLEYPVGTGLFIVVANWLTPRGENTTVWFYYVNAIMLLVCLIVAVVATALTVRRRPWDGAMFALAPGLILTATINWDLFAVALTSVFMLLWARKYPALAGIALGLAAAAKFYPLLLLGPLLLLCIRAGRLGAFGRLLATAVLAWAAVNLPFMLINFDGWSRFYTFSSERGEDFGSVWLVLTTLNIGVPPDVVNIVATGFFAVLCLWIGAIIFTSERRPRLAQVAFLVIAAFLLTNKVYSPQYVLWLIPLAVMARPRWRDFLLWQAGEVAYYFAIWWYLAGFSEDSKGLPVGWYAAAIVIHLAATTYFAVIVIRDIYRPVYDPVRTDGWPEDQDDPGGGVLDNAPDRMGPLIAGRRNGSSAMTSARQ
jgi:uncharacterized membrane protein